MDSYPDSRSAAMWADLHGHTRRWAPRYADAYGTCLICGLGATALIEVGRVTNAYCGTCDTRWVAGIDAFDPTDDPEPADPVARDELRAMREEMTFNAMLMLAKAHHFDEDGMTTTSTQTAIPLFDPWPTARTAQRCHDLGAPRRWHFLHPEHEAPRFGGTAVIWLRHPELQNACTPSMLLCATYTQDLRGAGVPKRAAALLTPFYVAADSDRAVWRRAGEAMRDPRIAPLIDEAVNILRHASETAARAIAIRDAMLRGR